MNYKIGISFASEYRHRVYTILKSLLLLGFSKEDIFYDEFHESVINGSDADIKLENIYASKCSMAVVVISKEYLLKSWTNRIEWKAIRRLLNSEKKIRSVFLMWMVLIFLNLMGYTIQLILLKILQRLAHAILQILLKNKYDLLVGSAGYEHGISALKDKQYFYLG